MALCSIMEYDISGLLNEFIEICKISRIGDRDRFSRNFVKIVTFREVVWFKPDYLAIPIEIVVFRRFSRISTSSTILEKIVDHSKSSENRQDDDFATTASSSSSSSTSVDDDDDDDDDGFWKSSRRFPKRARTDFRNRRDDFRNRRRGGIRVGQNRRKFSENFGKFGKIAKIHENRGKSRKPPKSAFSRNEIDSP